jgi:two-component sensor histidine kinase
VRDARGFVAQALDGSPAQVLDDVQLMVSELTTNVIQHVLTDFQVSVGRIGQEIRVEVSDDGGGAPAIRPVLPEACNGRGLQIVDSLATQWGVHALSDSGKTVWFTVALTGPDDLAAVPLPASLASAAARPPGPVATA